MTDDLVRIIREGLRRYEKHNVYRATLGDGQGNVKVAGEPFKAWARIQYLNGIEKRQIRIQKIRPVNNAPVLVKQGYDDEWEAIEGDPAQLNYWTGVGSPNVPEHAVSHQRWGNDPLLLQSLMFNPLLITPTNPVGTSVYVYPLFYRHDGTYKYYAGGTYGVATSGNLPGTAGHQQVSIVGLDATNNTPAIYNGASELVPPIYGQSVPFAPSEVATVANNATIGSDFIPGVAVRLYEGQTEVNLYDIFQDARQWLTLESSSTGGSSFTDQTAAVYVSKIGNDSDDGLTPDKPKLTIGAAITAASALLTAGADTVRIEVQDGGQYSESLTIPSNVTLDAPAATLIGELDLEDDTVIILDRHYASANSDIMVDRSSGGGVAYYYVNLSDGRGTGGSLTDVLNVRNVSNGSVLHVHAQVLIVCEDGRGVSDTAAGFGHTHLYAGDVYLGGNSAVGVAAYGSGSKLIGYVDHFLEIGSPATTTALGVQNANADVIMTVSEIIADTAYNIVSGDLYLQCPKITGTQTGTPAYITPGVQSQTANTVYAAPDGSPGTPTFRALVADDLPDLSKSTLKVKNTSGGSVAANDIGYIDAAGEFKTTTTENDKVAWCVVTTGGADGADIYVARRGRVTVLLNGNCSAGDFLVTSTTAKQAKPISNMRPEVFAVAVTANAGGSGGTCEALLLTQSVYVADPVSPTAFWTAHAEFEFTSTISSTSGTDIVYGAVTGNDNTIDMFSTYDYKIVLHNTTRSETALIESVDTGTTTITLTANVPGTWQTGDAITAISQIYPSKFATHTYFYELDVAAVVPPLAYALTLNVEKADSVAAGELLIASPYQSTLQVQIIRSPAIATSGTAFEAAQFEVPLIERKILVGSGASNSTSAETAIRQVGYTVKSP